LKAVLRGGFHFCEKLPACFQVWKSVEKIIQLKRRRERFGAVRFWEKCQLRGIPPHSHPFECLDWRGVYKNALQNLEPEEVTCQNLENKRVSSALAIFSYTASALTMMCSLNFGVKVRCHTTTWPGVDFFLRLEVG
jgi:hypothetical protein